MLSEKEIQTKVNFLSSARCNHTFHKYIDITGDLIEGTLLSRILYWFMPTKDNKTKVRIFKDGYYWIAKQRKDWWEEIRITERQYDKAIKELVNKGLVITAKYKFNSMPTIHIRPNYDVINARITEWENSVREEVVAEEQELQNVQDGNDIKCNSLGNDTKCKTGITEDVTLLTGITNTDYLNTNYNSFITDKVNTSDVSDVKVNTFPTGKGEGKKLTRKQLEEKQSDMIKRFNNICDDNLQANPIIKDCVKNVFTRYMVKYNNHTDKIHPILKDETLLRIALILAGAESGENSLLSETETYTPYDGSTMFDDMVDLHFLRKHRQETDWSIVCFANAEYLDKLASGLI